MKAISMILETKTAFETIYNNINYLSINIKFYLFIINILFIFVLPIINY